MQKAVEEIVSLQKEGVVINSINYSLNIKMLCADVPSRSYILKVTGHTGYSCCIKWCYGEHIDNHMRFPD